MVVPGADHRVGDIVLAVGRAAVVIAHHGYVHLHQGASQAAALRGGAPPGNGAHGAGAVLLPVAGQTDRPDDRAAEVRGLLQLQHADVVLHSPAVVALVQHNPADGDVLLIGIVLVQVVVADADASLLADWPSQQWPAVMT